MDLIKQLDRIFCPRTIAVIGASANPEKVGFRVLANLLEAGFKGRIYPVNPGLTDLFGLRVYPSVSTIPGEIDLAMVVIPSELTIFTMEECAAREVKGAVLISGGFGEVGTEIGSDLQDQLRDIANKGGMKIIGPNTLGLINPGINLTASFQYTLSLSKVGNVAVVAQSGGMCIYIVHALTNHNVGISKAMGVGNRCNLDFGEIVTYLGQDEQTRVIVIYVEGLEQPRLLMDAARQVVRRKPIVAYKGGRNKGIDKATLSHTGALAGQYEFYRAAFTQAGIIVVDEVTDLIDITKALAFQPPSNGNRVAIFSVQAGAGIVMADRCHELGLRLAQFSQATRDRLRQLASPLNAVDNPVDVAWKSNEFGACREMLKVALEDDGVDALVVAAVFYDSNMELMRAVIDIAGNYQKPVTVCLDSPRGAAYAEINALEEKGIPVYPLPERAVSGLSGLVGYGEILWTMVAEGVAFEPTVGLHQQRFSRPSP